MNSSYTILIINNFPDRADTTASIFEQSGCRVLTASNEKQGYEIAERELPDLIIGGTAAPNDDGTELCRLFRADSKLQFIPILFIIPSDTNAVSILKTDRTVADDYIESTFEPLRLLAKAAHLIERRRMEEKLREKDYSFRNLIEHLTDLVSILTPDGTVIYESPSIKQMLGYGVEELIGRNALELIHPEDTLTVTAYFNDALKSSTGNQPITYRYRHKDDSWRILESVGKCFNDPLNGLVAIINTRDITKQSNLLEAQRESEKRLQIIFDNSAIGIALVNSDERIVQSNRALEKMLGYSAEELNQKSFAEITHPEDLPLDSTLARQVFEGKRHYYQIEKRYIRKNGEIMWGNLTASVVQDANGKNSFTGMVEDITVRKRVEKEKAELTTQIERQRQRLDNIVANMPGIIWEIWSDYDETNRRVNFVSDYVEKMLGYTVEEWLATPNFWLSVVHPEDFEKARRQGVENLNTNEKRIFELRLITKNGRVIWTEMQTQAITDGENKPIGVRGIAIDITERRQTELALRQSEERFRAQFKGIPIPTFVWRKTEDDFVLTDYNDAGVELTRGGISKILGEKASEIYYDAAQVTENIHRCFSEKTIIKHEGFYNLKSSGETKYLDASYVFVPPDVVMIHARDITEQKQFEDSLRKSEERFELVALATNDALWDWDLTTDVVWYSEGYYKLFGFSPEEVRLDVNLWYGAIHPDDRERVIRKTQAVIKEGENTWTYEYRLRSADGSITYIFDRGYVIYDENGKPLRMIGAAVNITDRKLAEQVIQANQARLEKQNKVLNELTKHYKLFHEPFEKAIRKITEIAAKTLETERVSIWLYADNKSKIKAIDLYELNPNRHSENLELTKHDYPKYFKALAKDEAIVAHDAHTDSRTGEFSELYLKPLGITSMLDAPIRINGQVVGVVCHEHIGDAREWKLDEQNFAGSMAGLVSLLLEVNERRQAEDALRESQQHLALAQQVGNIGSFDLDLKTRIVKTSSEMQSLYGVLSGDALLKEEDFVKYFHPKDAARVRQEMEEALSSGEINTEYRIVRDDGSTRWIAGNAKVFYDADGTPLRMVGVNTDITERRQTESTLRFQKTLLKAQSEASIDGILVVTPKQENLSYNRRLAEMWGISDEVLESNSDELFLQAILNKLADPQEFLTMVSYFYQHPFAKNQVEISLKDGRTFERYSAPVTDAADIHYGRIWSFRDITERKLSEEKLRKSEERYRLLFDSNPLPMWVYEVETLRFLAVNDAAVAHYGYSREEFFSMTIKDIRPSEDIPDLLRNIAQINSGIDAAVFWRHRKKNGEIIDVEITSHEVVFAGSRAKLVMAIDVTERKKAEESIHFQAHLLDTVEQSVIAADLDGTIIYWNWFAHKLYGWTAAEAVGRNVIKLTAPQISKVQTARFIVGLRKGKSWAGESIVQNKDGRNFPAQIFSSPITDDKGKLIGFVGISIDITQRKEAEAALIEANERAIREYDRLLQRIGTLAQTVGTARDLAAIFSAILDFACASVPCSALTISLYNKESKTRKVIYLWFNGNETEASNIEPVPVGQGPVGQAVKSGDVIIFNDYLKTFGRRPTNVYLYYDEDSRDPRSTIIAPMKIMGDVIGVIEVQSYESEAYTQEHATAMRMAANLAANAIENVRLLESEKHNAEQLRQSQKLESVGRLAGGIAHDFNNMLTAINGYSDLTLRRLSADDPLRRFVEEIKKAGERSAGLTNQLLAFSRRQVLKPKILEINQVVTETSQMLQRLIGEDIQLNISLDAKLGSVKADPGQITQVIMNLVVNARDAMPRGGNLTIETRNVYLDEDYAAYHLPTQSGSYILLAVSDTGTGIDDETRQHIFEPFFTTKQVGKGTGLGLATVYGIVKQSGGYIWIYSEVGVGTTFKIYLPRVDGAGLLEETPLSTEIPNGTETILLVEDEEIVRNLSRQILEACGYTVIEARNGIEALEVCASQEVKIDLLMTDVVMPQMGGRELSERLAETNPRISVLFTSGYTDDAIIRQGVIKVGSNFIQKPFTFDLLAQKVREVLDKKDI